MAQIIRFSMVLLLLLSLDYGFYELIWKPVWSQGEFSWDLFFWSIPILAAANSLLFPRRSTVAIQEPLQRDIRATIFLTYASKFLGLAFVLMATLLLGAGLGLADIIGSPIAAADQYYYIVKLAGLLLTVVLIGLLLWGMFFNRYRYKVHSVKIPIDDLPDSLEGFTLVQISDIHAGSFTQPEYLKPGIDLINAQRPDLICFTGDLVNNMAKEIEPYLPVFRELNAKHGIYSILGNHDYGDYVQWPNQVSKSANLDQLAAAHEALGWNLLRDEAKTVQVAEGRISLIGVENISGRGRFKVYGNLQRAYTNSEAADLKILLSHDPSHWRQEVLNYVDINLCLSGHTHGMQFGLELGKFFKWSPVKFAYKEWAGLYQEGEQYLYVNRGFGFLGYPGRVGILPEITRIEFVKSKN